MVIKVDVGTIIVGAGVSGMCLAMTLRNAGQNDFIVLEKAQDIGGTWRDNDYPGCASDIPAHIYSYSFAMHPSWNHRYGSQAEILRYLRQAAQRFDVLRKILFGVTAVSAVYDEEQARWTVQAEDGSRFSATALVLAVGAIHQPAIPEIPGFSAFNGTAFHSSRWDHGCDISGKNIAVIGTGASSVQIIPKIAPYAGRLFVFQRTAPWVLPRRDGTYNSTVRMLFRKLFLFGLLYRWYLYWRAEARVLAFKRYKWLLRVARFRAMRHLRRQVPDSDLRRMLTPKHAIGCKQLLLSSTYYPTLTRDNVEVITTPITEIDDSTITTADGTTRPVDVIVLATGFHILGSLDFIQITGRDGLDLQETWRTGAEAFLGICVSGFPNLFLMVGPNSGLAHTSMIFMIEDQARYISQALRRLDRGVRSLDVDLTVQRKFNSALHRRLQSSVWSLGGCRSWYLDQAGINRVLWPNSTVSYWWRTRRFSERHFTRE
ncbi:flavin-containing monooxygenase [Nonomuraea sp. NPDC049480]|uniref:flavin-containing monooxygenase n=1 Tax=Nonomuraea sp. NPDC049480 TaxID=3364353 RepID=UPI0037AE4B5D